MRMGGKCLRTSESGHWPPQRIVAPIVAARVVPGNEKKQNLDVQFKANAGDLALPLRKGSRGSQESSGTAPAAPAHLPDGSRAPSIAGSDQQAVMHDVPGRADGGQVGVAGHGAAV